MKGTSTLIMAGLASAVGAARIAGGSPCSSHPPAATSTTVPTNPTGPKYFITFGDSYSQSGFSFSGTKPTAENPLGNPPLPGWTASGGMGWVAFAATEYNNDVLLSYNLAYGGATTAADLVTPYAPEVLSFEDQVQDLFVPNLAVEPHPSWAPWEADNTLVGVWIGVNDVGNTFWFSDIQQRYETIMVRYFGLLQTVYDAGARQFAILSVPPTWRTPAFLAQDQTATGPVATAIDLYNDLIQSHLATFKAANPDAKTWLVDTALPFDKALANPTAYGAPNATCWNEDGTSCLWFNDYHPGVAIQKLVAEEVAQVVGAPFFEV